MFHREDILSPSAHPHGGNGKWTRTVAMPRASSLKPIDLLFILTTLLHGGNLF